MTAMSGHTNTQSDQYVEVLDMQFNPDATPSSANMTMDLGASQSLLTCRLTKAVWWYRPSPGEGKPDCQSLFGRLDWSEEIANPSPLGSQSDSRAKWVGKTGFCRSRHTTAFVEWSSAVHNKTSEIGVSDAPTDRSETRGRSVGAFSSVRRAGRLRIANGHAGNRVSDIHEGLLGCRGTNLSTFSTRVQARRVMSLQRPVPAFSDWNASGLDPQGVAVLTDEMSCPVLSGPHKRTPSSGASRGTHGFLVPARDPWDSPAQATCRSGLRPLGKSANPTPEPTTSDPQVLRFCQAGRLLPAPSGPHQQGTPPWEFPGSNRDPMVPGNTEEPPGSRQRRRDDPQALVCGEPDARVSGPSID
jgi:hypothetical protein